MPYITCPECGGEGSYIQITNLTYEKGVWDELVRCEMCDGGGEIECPHNNINLDSKCLDCGTRWDENGDEVLKLKDLMAEHPRYQLSIWTQRFEDDEWKGGPTMVDWGEQLKKIFGNFEVVFDGLFYWANWMYADDFRLCLTVSTR